MLFILSNFYFIFKFIAFFLCLLQSVVESIHWVFSFSYHIFQFYNFHLVLLYIFYFFAETYPVCKCSLNYWLMNGLSDNFSICVTSMLMSVDFFHSSEIFFSGSCYDKWFLLNFWIWANMSWNWIFYKTPVLADIFDTVLVGRRRGHWLIITTQFSFHFMEEDGFLVTSGWRWKFGLPL